MYIPGKKFGKKYSQPLSFSEKVRVQKWLHEYWETVKKEGLSAQQAAEAVSTALQLSISKHQMRLLVRELIPGESFAHTDKRFIDSQPGAELKKAVESLEKRVADLEAAVARISADLTPLS